MTKKDFVVGQKVRGYGLLNEYGEFEFIPEQTGIRKGQQKLITQGDGYTLSETRDKVIVHISFPKGPGRLKTIVNFSTIIQRILYFLQKYEF